MTIAATTLVRLQATLAVARRIPAALLQILAVEAVAAETKYSELSEVVKELRRIAMKYNIVVHTATQLPPLKGTYSRVVPPIHDCFFIDHLSILK